MRYDFDEVYNRHNTNSIKWDFMEKFMGVSSDSAIPMWVADMDFRAPAEVISAVKKVAEHGIYGYSSFPNSYYEAYIEWMQRHHRWNVEKDWIVFTPGVVPALNIAVQTFSDPGDEVILQTPIYYPFLYAVKNNQRRILDNPLALSDGKYVMDYDDLLSKINARTKILLLCSPQNPRGRVWTKEELRRLGDICLEKGIIVIADEIHEDIVYHGYQHTPFADICPEFAQNSVTCTGISKTFNLPGLEMSNIVIPNTEIRKRFRETVSSCGIGLPNIFGVAATEAAYRYGDEWLEQVLEYLEGNLKRLTEFFENRLPEIKVFPIEGTYLAWLDCRGLSVEPSEVNSFLCKVAKVVIEDGKIFGCREDGFVRMSFACPRSVLEEALGRIENAVRQRAA